MSPTALQMDRYGILSSGFNLMSFYALHGQDKFEDAREHIAIMSTKRIIPDSASSPCLRRSKRLAALSMDQSTDGRDDDENVRSGGEPKSPRRELNANQAMLLHAVYEGFKPDIATMWPKLHRKAKNPATLEGIQDSLKAVLENQFDIYAKLKKLERVVCSPSRPTHVQLDASTSDHE
ncbi:hypothetical protein RHSIM_Rhsim01G0153600 [Rhododendron simsii]|uniref:Uncharacterized protein n=1 Tax=Rhododendron simsii TaxID=118357 RepID=A0A834HF28_RHOSS|nr:hypothetical protein RHSIM_Rhsim01G0153600 [Rhododendron simsii]